MKENRAMINGERIAKIVLLSNERQIGKLLKSNLDFKNTEFITFIKDLTRTIKKNQSYIDPKFYYESFNRKRRRKKSKLKNNQFS